MFVCLCVGVCEYERPALARELYDTNVLDTNLFTEITVCHVAYQYATRPGRVASETETEVGGL